MTVLKAYSRCNLDKALLVPIICYLERVRVSISTSLSWNMKKCVKTFRKHLIYMNTTNA